MSSERVNNLTPEELVELATKKIDSEAEYTVERGNHFVDRLIHKNTPQYTLDNLPEFDPKSPEAETTAINHFELAKAWKKFGERLRNALVNFERDTYRAVNLDCHDLSDSQVDERLKKEKADDIERERIRQEEFEKLRAQRHHRHSGSF